MQYLEAQQNVTRGILADLRAPIPGAQPTIAKLVDGVGLPASAFDNKHLRYFYKASAEAYIDAAVNGTIISLEDVFTRLETIYRYNGHQHNASELLGQWRSKVVNQEDVTDPIRSARTLKNYRLREQVKTRTAEFLQDLHASENPTAAIADHIAYLNALTVTDGIALNIKAVIEAEGKSMAVPEPSGYPRLDGKGRDGILAVKGHQTGGYLPGRLIIMVGEPGVGKSTVAINLAVRRAEMGLPVVFHSFEMDRATIYRTMVSSSAACTADVAFAPERAGQDHAPHIQQTIDLLDIFVRVYDEPADLGLIAQRMRRHHVEFGDCMTLHIIDHIGAFAESNKQAWRELQAITHRLGNMGNEHNACLLVLSHPAGTGSTTQELRDHNRATSTVNAYGGKGVRQWADVVFLVGRHNGIDEAGMPRRELTYATIFQGSKNRQGKGSGDRTYFVLRFDPVTENLTQEILIDDQSQDYIIGT